MGLFDLIIPAWLRASLKDNADATREHAVSLDRHSAAIDRNTEALEAGHESADDLFNFTIGPVTNKREAREGVPQMKVLISDEEKITLTMNPKTRSGRPANVQNPSWTSADPSIVTVEPTADGKSCALVSQSVGTTTIHVSADADLGDGVRALETDFDFEVAAAEASDLGLTAGEPELK